MNTVTDDEIMTAIKYCKSTNCDNCIWLHNNISTDYECKNYLIGEAFKLINKQNDLINLQAMKINKLKSERDKLKFEMSYMVNPNSIGDRHEMGCW